MRRWMLVALVAGLLAPAVAGQPDVWNDCYGTDGWAAPGERVLAQMIFIDDMTCVWSDPVDASGTWTAFADVLADDGTCSTTATDGAELFVDFDFAIPVGATILYLGVEVLGAGGGDSMVLIDLWNQDERAPVGWIVDLAEGDCGDVEDVWAEGDQLDWGVNWSRADVNEGIRVELTARPDTGATIYVDAVWMHVCYALDDTITQVVVRNTGVGNLVEGDEIERIEVVRAADREVIGTQRTGTQLDKFTGAGVPVEIETGERGFTGQLELEIYITLESDVPLLDRFVLGETEVTVDGDDLDVDYSLCAAEQFAVGPPPIVGFDGLVPDGEVYPGQRFLAGRIMVDATDVPFDLEIDRVDLRNDIGANELTGAYIDSIEIRRASDGALLGQATAAEIEKLTTTRTRITTSSYDEISAYSEEGLEIWVTLAVDAPTGKELRLSDDVWIGEFDFGAGAGPLFTVGQPMGFEDVANQDLDLTDPRVFSEQRFLAQRIEVGDDDFDPFDVTVSSLVVQNVAAADRLAESQIASIEVVRARDGASMGLVTDVTGLNGGGVRITTDTNNAVQDDTQEGIELWVTLAEDVPHDRAIMLQATVWHAEDTRTFGILADGAVDSEEFLTGPADEKGFEKENPVAVDDRTVFQSVRFLAQRLKLEDDDLDPNSVTITSLMVRNIAPDRLADQYVYKLEVRRRSDGKLLGSVTDPVGLSLAGVRVTASANNAVLDDGAVQLEVWVTLKQNIPTGRKVQLESIVWHTEGTATFQTDELVGPATFTTDLGDPPTGVNFSWTPADPTYEDEITFTPAAGIADPEGDIANAEFHWNFGDGKTKKTNGSATVKHTYGAGGTFTVALTVTGEDGIASSKSRDVTVEGPPNEPPMIDEVTADPENPAAGENVEFAATVTDPDQPDGTAFGYEWDFGDEATSTVANPTHSYDADGTYTVTVTVTDERGATDTATIDVTVGNDPPTLAGVTANPATGVGTGDEVTFTAAGYDDPDDDAVAYYEWDFDDGTTANTEDQSTTHVFAAPDDYTVSVVAVDVRGARSAAETVDVTVTGPARTILYAFPNPAGTTATFTYFLPEGATEPILRVYGLLGDLVIEQELPEDGTTFVWDLRTTGGTRLPNGIYFCVVTATGANRSEVFRLLIDRQ